MKLFFEYIIRNIEIDNTIVTGKIEGRPDRGKQVLTFTKTRRLSNLMEIEGV